jgi:hypothetical protein
MQKKNNKEKDTKNSGFPGYPHYSWRDDIYMNEKEEEDIDPENTNKKKPVNDTSDFLNEKDFSTDLIGDDLDVPGAELDDAMEEVGSEDEENNYFSLGGDNHENLEEDQGDERR